MSRSSGSARATSRSSLAFLKVRIPEKLMSKSRASISRAKGRSPVKQWITPPTRSAPVASKISRELDERVARVAARPHVDHERPVRLSRDSDLRRERARWASRGEWP